MDFNKMQNVKLIYADRSKLENSGLLGVLCQRGLG